MTKEQQLTDEKAETHWKKLIIKRKPREKYKAIKNTYIKGFKDGVNIGFQEARKETLIEVEKMIKLFEDKTINNKEQIINEADLQSEAIEFSYTGKLFPVEKLEYEIDEIKQQLSQLGDK